uniref:Uncharacterized protein n=1 Tax=Rhizophora mucronata TaxID=61149 RepID=A0A2P2J4L2_RHIMU
MGELKSRLMEPDRSSYSVINLKT